MRTIQGVCLLVALAAGCNGGQTIRIYEENDAGSLGGGTDRYYTQGLKIEYTSSIDGDVPVLTPATQTLGLCPGDGDYAFRSQFLGLSAGQQIYTPQDITVPTLIENDRPYAGWLYGSFSLHNVALAYGASPQDLAGCLETRDDRLDSLELQGGIVGPSSLAEDTQIWFHHVIGSDEPQGWDNQLDDEPGVNLIYTRKHRNSYSRWSFWGIEQDLISNVGASLGNVHTHFQVGGQFRVGQRLRRDFGLAVNAPDLDIREVVDDRVAVERLGDAPEDQRLKERLAAQFGERFSWFTFFGVDGRAVLWNVFLDGNAFSSSHSVRKEYFVADFKLGLALQWPAFEISYTQVVRTPEFRRGSDPQIFGSLQIAFQF